VLSSLVGGLNRFEIFFSGTDADDLFHGGDKDFTVSDFTGTRRRNQLIDDHIDLLIFDDDLDLEFLEKFDGILGTAITFRLTFLTTETSNFVLLSSKYLSPRCVTILYFLGKLPVNSKLGIPRIVLKVIISSIIALGHSLLR